MNKIFTKIEKLDITIYVMLNDLKQNQTCITLDKDGNVIDRTIVIDDEDMMKRITEEECHYNLSEDFKKELISTISNYAFVDGEVTTIGSAEFQVTEYSADFDIYTGVLTVVAGVIANDEMDGGEFTYIDCNISDRFLKRVD